MHCPRDKKLVFALGSAVLGLIFWVVGMAVDAKLDKPAAEALILIGGALMLLACVCGACAAQQRLELSANHQRLLADDEENARLIIQNPDGSLPSIAEFN